MTDRRLKITGYSQVSSSKGMLRPDNSEIESDTFIWFLINWGRSEWLEQMGRDEEFGAVDGID